MKYTNKFNLPQPLVKAVSFPDYNRGDSEFSVTGLLSPPRIAVLKRKHESELETDVSENIWALCGSIGHALLQKGSQGEITEKRFYTTIDGIKISGQMDYGNNGQGLDWKFVSIWVAKEGLKPEHTQQANCYRYLAHKNGVEINSYQVVYIFRDFSKNEARRNPDYPQSQVLVCDVPIWPLDITEKFLRDRIKLHLDAQKNLPECSPDERWQKSDSWALKKEGQKRAVKVYYDADAANHHLAKMDKKHFVEFRKGESVRCQSYCPVLKFCEQGQRLLVKSDPENDAF